MSGVFVSKEKATHCGDPLTGAVHVNRDFGKGPRQRGEAVDQMSALVLPLGVHFRLYWVVSAVALPLLRCACTFAASYTACSWGPCWLTIAPRYFHARMAALRVLGPSSGWFLAAVASMSVPLPQVIWLVPCPKGHA